MRFVVLAMLLSGIAQGKTLRIEVSTGTAIQMATPLTIQQAGQPTINEAAAGYSTNPFASGSAPYYDARIGLWNDEQTSGWELELLHDKLYLDTLPPEVQEFRITFGYNYLFLNRAWAMDDFFFGGPHWLIFRVGIGPVICHPISTVRGQEYTGAMYSVAGIGYQLALQGRLEIVKGLSAHVETKWTGASAVVPIANGEAVVPNNGVHFLFGVGYDF